MCGEEGRGTRGDERRGIGVESELQYKIELSLTAQIFPRPLAVLVHPYLSQGSRDLESTQGGVASRYAPGP